MRANCSGPWLSSSYSLAPGVVSLLFTMLEALELECFKNQYANACKFVFDKEWQ